MIQVEFDHDWPISRGEIVFEIIKAGWMVDICFTKSFGKKKVSETEMFRKFE